jgi:hypothetical protein
VIDRRWNIVLTNRAVEPFLTGVDPELLRPPINMVRLGLHSGGLAPRIVNLAQVRACLSRQLAQSWDPEIAALYDEFLASDTVEDGTTVSIESEITIPMSIRHRGQVLRLFSTITTFGTPQDVTLEEIAIESYYPADRRTPSSPGPQRRSQLSVALQVLPPRRWRRCGQVGGAKLGAAAFLP